MFMFDWVPEPVCHTTSGNSPSCCPATTSSAAPAMASARRGSRSPRSRFTSADGLLDEGEGVHERQRHALVADAEVLDRALGLRAPESVGGHGDRAERVGLGASLSRHLASPVALRIP